MGGLAEELFGREQVEKAARYNRPGYVAWAANTLIGLGVLALFAASGRSSPACRGGSGGGDHGCRARAAVGGADADCVRRRLPP